MTHTFATLEVSDNLYEEVAAKLKEAGYDHAFMEDGAIDMHGIGLTKKVVVPYVEPPATMNCPRRGENGQMFYGIGRQDVPANGMYDRFTDQDDCCTYCGSLNPDEFMARLEAGNVKIVPTDKDYKVYVQNYGGDEFTQTTRTDSNPWAGYGNPIHNWQISVISQKKFYFQHLSQEQRQRFVELLNEKKIVFAEPGRFYVKPFFIA